MGVFTSLQVLLLRRCRHLEQSILDPCQEEQKKRRETDSMGAGRSPRVCEHNTATPFAPCTTHHDKAQSDTALAFVSCVFVS